MSGLKRLAARAGLWLLRFLWQQVKWWLWIVGFAAAGYISLNFLHQFWIASILLWIAIFIAVGWFLNLIKYQDQDTGDRPGRPRESPFERQRKEFEEDMNRYQREEEDKGGYS